jgi:hypothetical protein
MSYSITPTSGINLDDVVQSTTQVIGATTVTIPANGPAGSQVFGSDGLRYVLGVAGAAITASTATCSINASTFVATPSAGSAAYGTTGLDTTEIDGAELILSSDPAAGTIASSTTTGVGSFTFTPTKAGTYVIKATPTLSSGTAVSTAKTWTVTVAAKTVGKSSAFLKGAGIFPVTDTATADATVTLSSAASTSAQARIDVASIYGTTGNETASAADAPIVVVATDKGLVSGTNAYFGGMKSVTTAAGVDACIARRLRGHRGGREAIR